MISQLQRVDLFRRSRGGKITACLDEHLSALEYEDTSAKRLVRLKDEVDDKLTSSGLSDRVAKKGGSSRGNKISEPFLWTFWLKNSKVGYGVYKPSSNKRRHRGKHQKLSVRATVARRDSQ